MADISYTRTTWADGAEGGTAIDATKLNNIEQGIVDAVAAIGPNDTTEDGTLKAQIDENTSDIETLQESVSWKLVGQKSDGTALALPSGWSELFIRVWMYDDNISFLHVIREGLFGSRSYYLITGAGTAVSGGVQVLEGSAKVAYYSFNGQDRTSTVNMSVYYR